MSDELNLPEGDVVFPPAHTQEIPQSDDEEEVPEPTQTVEPTVEPIKEGKQND